MCREGNEINTLEPPAAQSLKWLQPHLWKSLLFLPAHTLTTQASHVQNNLRNRIILSGGISDRHGSFSSTFPFQSLSLVYRHYNPLFQTNAQDTSTDSGSLFRIHNTFIWRTFVYFMYSSDLDTTILCYLFTKTNVVKGKLVLKTKIHQKYYLFTILLSSACYNIYRISFP